jgi:hypothetical protein
VSYNQYIHHETYLDHFFVCDILVSLMEFAFLFSVPTARLAFVQCRTFKTTVFFFDYTLKIGSQCAIALCRAIETPVAPMIMLIFMKMRPRVVSNLSLADKICMMMTRLACNRAIESSYWRMDNDWDVGLLTGYVLYRLPVEQEFMDLDTFPH